MGDKICKPNSDDEANTSYAALSQLLASNIDHPPLNIFGPDTIPQTRCRSSRRRNDEAVKVVSLTAPSKDSSDSLRFRGASREHNSFTAGADRAATSARHAVRLSRAPVVSDRVNSWTRDGVGSELALACDMRFASREKAILSHFEVGAGVVPGGAQWHGYRVSWEEDAHWKCCSARMTSG